MDTSRVRRTVLGGLLLPAVAFCLLAVTGPASAAQRTVVGELFSQDG